MMCTCCGELLAAGQNFYGDWLCVVCLDIEGCEDSLDDCCDTEGNLDSLYDLEQCILNGEFFA